MPSSRRSTRRPYHAGHVELDLSRATGGLRTQTVGGETWAVRTVTSEKSYLCPGCNQVIAPGVSHLVTWRQDGWQGEAAGLAERRHWHSSCWSRWCN